MDYVRDKILRVYTFGSPPVTTVPHDFYDDEVEEYLRSIGGLPESHPEMEPYKCDTLKAFGLSCSMVYGFVQPWVSVVIRVVGVFFCYHIIRSIIFAIFIFRIQLCDFFPTLIHCIPC